MREIEREREEEMQSNRKWVEKRGEKNQRATEMENVCYVGIIIQ